MKTGAPAALRLFVLVGFAATGHATASESPSGFAAQDQGLDGTWRGTVRDESEQTALVIRLWRAEDGGDQALIELPDIDVFDWPAIGVEVDGPRLEITLPSFVGRHTLAITRISTDTLEGTWLNPQFEGPARLRVTRWSADPRDVGDRWAGTEEVVFYGGAGKLVGSIVFPEGDGPFPAAVFVHGSGPLDRLTFLSQARALAAYGIASFIFDKRGAGESEGEWITADLFQLADDVVAAADALTENPRISANQIGFIGHSQGGWVAPLAASKWGRARFIVSQAGPATTVAEETWWNVQVALREAGYGEDVVQEAIGVLMLFEGGILTGNWRPFELRLAEVKEESWYEASRLETFDRFRQSEQLVRYYRGISTYDPMPILSSLETPLLSLMGDRDEEQPWDRSQEIYQELSLAGRPISVHVYPNVNHGMVVAYFDDGSPVRFKRYPADFFSRQANFIYSSLSNGRPGETANDSSRP